MMSTIAVVVLLLAPSTGSGAAATTRAVQSAAVAQATAATPEASAHTAVVPPRQRPRGSTIGLVALFGALAGVGLFDARTAGREPEE